MHIELPKNPRVNKVFYSSIPFYEVTFLFLKAYNIISASHMG